MEKLELGSPETQSADIVAENIERLRNLFPEAFTEGRVDFDELRELLGDAVETEDEKYGLNWYGKRTARRLALTPSTGTLRPAPEESVDWDTTQNLMIEGDNLEVLKLLQKSYAGRVKLIYIDPPYNTGNDFVYPDDFKDNIRNYLELTGQLDGEGKKVSTNPESSGRFHTAWLNMMYPRLLLARQLLSDDGVIFVSIDDSELANLTHIMDYAFGDDGFVGRFIWRKKYTLSYRDEHMIPIHEYIVCYKSRGDLDLVDPRWKDVETVTVNPVFKSQNARSTKLVRKGATLRGGGDLTISAGEITLPSQTVEFHDDACFREGELQSDVRVTAGFAVGQQTLDNAEIEMSTSGAAYVIGGAEERRIRPISILFDYTKDDKEFIYEQYHHRRKISTRQATAEVESLLSPRAYSNPKPSSLISFLLSTVSNRPGDIALDFFAGSGTTGHAVMVENAVRGSDWRHILVQLPELVDPTNREQKGAAEYCLEAGVPLSIAEITKARLRQAGAKLREEHPDHEGDLGFRVFKLDSSNIRAWEPSPDDLETTLFDSVDHLRDNRTEDDILFELLLKLGLDLAVPMEDRTIAGKKVHSIGVGVLFVCLAEGIGEGVAEALATGIVGWRAELDPAGDTTCVFRDSGFENDVAKTNLAAILEQHGIETVRSL